MIKGLNIRIKFILYTSVVLVIGLFIVASIIYQFEKKAQLLKTDQYASQIVYSRAAEVGKWLNGLVNELNSIAKGSEVVSMDWDKMEPVLNSIVDKRNDTYGFLFLIKPDGSYCKTKAGLQKANLATRRYFKEIMQQGKSHVISNPVISKSTGKKRCNIAVAIKNNGKTVGIIAGSVIISSMADIVTDIQIGDAGYGFILDNSGVVVAHKDEDLVLNFNINDADTKGYKGMSDIGKGMMNSTFGIYNIVTPENREDRLVYSQIPHSPKWSLAVAVPMHEITRGINDLLVRLLVGFTILLVILLGLLTALANSLIVNPVQKLYRFTKDLEQGDLSQKIEIRTNDEIGQMASALNSTVEKIRTIIKGIVETSGLVTQNSASMQESANTISGGANDQASSAEEVSATMEEMAANIEQNSNNSHETEKIANASAKGIELSNQNMKTAVDAMKNISGKVSIINDIAMQTNILALNAAVEAARAGELGKGFAVVAAEVRKLAERSRTAAEEITGLIVQGVDLSTQAGNQLDEIVPEIVKTANLVREINSASSEQTSGANQISDVLQQLSLITQNNMNSSVNLANNADELLLKAEELQSEISFFRV